MSIARALRRCVTGAGISLVLLSCLSTGSPAYAKKHHETPPAKEDKKDEDSPFKDWDKTLKDVETMKGLFAVHTKNDHRWLEIAPDQLDRPFLMVSSLTSGLGKGFVLGGMPLDTDLWVLHRAGNRIQVLIRNNHFRGPGQTPISGAVALSYADSVLATAKIVSVGKDTNHLLIDLDEIFIGDLPALSLGLKQFLGGPSSFDKDRSALSSLKVFPKNLEIEVSATYAVGEPKALDTVSDPRYLPLGIHYSLSELPENDYQARLADDRVGFFLTAVKDFSHDSSDTFFVRYINRWKLEKQDPSAALSAPKEPIVFYLDRTIPEQYRQAVREGTLMWNKAFEKAGFKDAIVVKDPPEDKDFDPDDVRYNTIRWITSSEPAFGAIGPSRVDPRNGHILDADILVEAAMIQNARRGYRNYVRPLSLTAPAGTFSLAGALSIPAPNWRSLLSGPAGHEGAQLGTLFGSQSGATCSFVEGAELSAAVDAAAFAVAGEMEPGGTVPEEYVNQFLHWVVAHEVGHTLGLRHNFRASSTLPNSRLNDVAWTREHGLYNSVMEYPPANYSLDRKAQGDYYTQSVGDYDLWAIQYGYTPLGGKTPEDDVLSLRRIAEMSTQPGHEYGTDEDAFAGSLPIGVDPDINHFDLGSDPLAYARDRLALIQSVRSKIQYSLVASGEGYERLRNTFDSLVAAQGIALQIASKQIGGLTTSRSHKGDPGERPSFNPIAPARQRQAMSLLADSGFSDAAWAASPQLLNLLQVNRWAHWGSDVLPYGQLDYPYTGRVLDVQSELLDRLLHPILLTRILETEQRMAGRQPYTLAEHMRSLTDAVFSEMTARSGGGFTISTTRRSLGRGMIERLVIILNSPAARTPEDARSLARSNLVSLDKRMASVLATRTAGMDETTRAYLEESRTRIRRALDAQGVLVF